MLAHYRRVRNTPRQEIVPRSSRENERATLPGSGDTGQTGKITLFYDLP